MDNRVLWIDVCKGIAIFLVILGHTSQVLRPYIYGFHMPLFFFLSGIVFNKEKYPSLKEFALSRFNSIVIPYAFFFLITYIFWLCIERNFRSFEMDWWKPLIGLFYGAQWKDYLLFNPILWFLPCLYVTELLGYIITSSKKYVSAIIIVLLVLLGSLFKDNLPWGINISFVVIQFFCVGYYLRTYIFQNKRNILQKYPLITILCCTLLLSMYGLFIKGAHVHVDIAQCKYSNFCFFELSSWFGVAIISAVSIALCEVPVKKINAILAWGGVSSMVIFALHQPIMRIVRFLSQYLLHFDITSNVLGAIFVCIVDIIILVPFIYIYNKKCVPVLKKIYL